MSTDEANERDDSDNPPAPTEVDAANPAEQTDLQEVSVEDQEITEKMQEAEVFGTYTKRIGPYKLQIGPVFTSTDVYWELTIYKEGVKGPLYQQDSSLSDIQAEWLGIETEIQESANKALQFANQHMHPSRQFRSQERPQRSFNVFKDLMENDA